MLEIITTGVEILGIILIITGLFLLFGLAVGLIAVGIALIIISYLVTPDMTESEPE